MSPKMATKRKAISTRIRFEIFKRDRFRCLYCGATPLQKPLHVDHVVAIANGGTNKPSNLITACGDCNLGKNAIPLERVLLAPAVATQADRDHAAQIREYLAIQRAVESARKVAVDAVAELWEEMVGPLSQDMYGRLDSILKCWSLETIHEAIRITSNKLGSSGKEYSWPVALGQTKYFYGILRRMANGLKWGDK